jgi:hypothetical protein
MQLINLQSFRVETRRENKSEGHTEDTNDLIAPLEELSLN